MKNNPLISVILPVYNCEKTVETAMRSILEQTYKNIELVVVNDMSTDNTLEVVRKIADKDARVKITNGKEDPYRYDQKLKRNVNAGYSARNAGFDIAQGEIITFQDADDASLPKRLEIQYSLLSKLNSTHLTMDWVRFDEKYLNKDLDLGKFDVEEKMINPDELYLMSQRSKGFISKLSPALNRMIPFHLKRKRIINKLFFGSLENYPGAGNSPMFQREVISHIRFRPLKDRIWPSFMGRGADKDFNFQVAETFKNSHVVFIPLYLWRVKDENPMYPEGLDDFLHINN